MINLQDMHVGDTASISIKDVEIIRIDGGGGVDRPIHVKVNGMEMSVSLREITKVRPDPTSFAVGQKARIYYYDDEKGDCEIIAIIDKFAWVRKTDGYNSVIALEDLRRAVVA